MTGSSDDCCGNYGDLTSWDSAAAFTSSLLTFRHGRHDNGRLTSWCTYKYSFHDDGGAAA